MLEIEQPPSALHQNPKFHLELAQCCYMCNQSNMHISIEVTTPHKNKQHQQPKRTPGCTKTQTLHLQQQKTHTQLQFVIEILGFVTLKIHLLFPLFITKEKINYALLM